MKNRLSSLRFSLISRSFPFPFHSQCDTCDSKKTTSLLEGARYAYARGVLFCILGFGAIVFFLLPPILFSSGSSFTPFLRFFVYFYLKYAESNVYVNSMLHFRVFRKKFVTFSCFFPSLRRYLPIYL